MGLYGTINQGLQFDGLLIKAKTIIEELRQVGIKLDGYDAQLQEIIEAYNAGEFIVRDTIVMSGGVPYATKKQVDPVEALGNFVYILEAEKEDYFKIARVTKSISNLLDCIVEANIPELFGETKDLLDKMEFSPNLDYENEKGLLEAAYIVVYNVMKLESVYDYDTGETLIEKVRNSETHSAFISVLLNEEIERSGNRELLAKRNQLTMQRLGSSFIIDRDLFKMVAMSMNDKSVRDLQNRLLRKVEEYFARQNVIKKNADILQESITSSQSILKRRDVGLAEFLKRTFFIVGSTCTIAGSFISSFLFFRVPFREYKTREKIFNSSTGAYSYRDGGFQTKDGYVTVVVEKPCEKIGVFNELYRKKTLTFSIKYEEGNNNPYYYIDQVAKNAIARSRTITETSKDEPEEFGKDSENYSVIFKEYGEEYQAGDQSVAISLSILVAIVFFIVAYGIYDNRIVVDDKNDKYSVVTCLRMYLSAFASSQTSKKDLAIDVNEIRDLINKNEQLLSEIQNDPSFCLLVKDIRDHLSDSGQKSEVEKLLKKSMF